MLSKLLQILFGPVIDVRPSDLDYLLRYGVLVEHEDGTTHALSEHFLNYLDRVRRSVDLWPIWTGTEISLRAMMTDILAGEYGDEWIDKLERKHNLQRMFDGCRNAHAKETHSLGERASNNLLDYTYPGDLFDIMFKEWSLFVKFFGKEKAYWNSRKTLLARVRNPLAHSRDVLHDHERAMAEGYCGEIAEIIRGWRKHPQA